EETNPGILAGAGEALSGDPDRAGGGEIRRRGLEHRPDGIDAADDHRGRSYLREQAGLWLEGAVHDAAPGALVEPAARRGGGILFAEGWDAAGEAGGGCAGGYGADDR